MFDVTSTYPPRRSAAEWQVLDVIDNEAQQAQSTQMSTGVAKNIVIGVLSLAVLILAFVAFAGGSSARPSSPVSATATTATIAAPVPTTRPVPTTTTAPASTTLPASVVPVPSGVAGCPTGTIALSAPAAIPTAASAGYTWTPATYPTAGWCEVRG